MNARSEPLIWLQLIAVGVLPLEALLLLLLLAGSDPGPLPALERLLCWGLGGLVPALVLWRRPADVWSLLLLQAPLRARRPLQQRLSALQEAAAIRVGLVGGSGLLLGLLWWSDEHAAMAGQLSPLAASPRLVGLLLAALLLALMLWQWQQLLQSLWLLSRSPGALEAVKPMSTKELEAGRLCLGLPLLLLDPLPARVAGSRPQPRSAQPARAEAALSVSASTNSKAETAQTPEPRPAAQAIASSGEAAPPDLAKLEASETAAIGSDLLNTAALGTSATDLEPTSQVSNSLETASTAPSPEVLSSLDVTSLEPPSLGDSSLTAASSEPIQPSPAPVEAPSAATEPAPASKGGLAAFPSASNAEPTGVVLSSEEAGMVGASTERPTTNAPSSQDLTAVPTTAVAAPPDPATRGDSSD